MWPFGLIRWGAAAGCLRPQRGARGLACALALAGALVCASWSPSVAQQRISFIRDAEIEATIRIYATPVFRAAGLNPDDISVHIVNDRSLNAFVAGGLNMFFHTGLLLRVETPNQLVGVIAHETGHISGGHLARLPDGMRASWDTMIISLLGAAAAAVAGNGNAAVASVLAGQQIAERQMLRYTRTLEASADQAGVTFLDRAQQSSRGLMEFLQVLADQELMVVDRQDPYVRSHPITAERVEFVRQWVANSRMSNMPSPPGYAELHKRMRAKLLGFTDPSRTFVQYREGETSAEGRYARAFAFYRRGEMQRAIALADSLLAEAPDDPYYNESRGQFTYEGGKPRESLPYYEKAVAGAPNSALLRLGLASAMLATDDRTLLPKAIEHLEAAQRLETNSAELWRQLSVAYGRDGQLGMSALAQAEQALLLGRRVDARGFAERAERLLPAGSPHILRIQDIKNAAESLGPQTR